jgi:hypothetical protein
VLRAEQWAALHHLMEYLESNPSFKITYQRGAENSNLLSGYADSDWGNSSSRRSTSGMLTVQQMADLMPVQYAENLGSLDC